MNIYSRIVVANQELDLAELRYKKTLSKEQLDLLNASRNMYGLTSTVISDHYDEFAKLPKGAGAIFLITSANNIMIDTIKGESYLKQAVGLLGDAIITILSFTPHGRLIM